MKLDDLAQVTTLPVTEAVVTEPATK